VQLFNATPLEAGYAPGLLKNGRQCMVLVAKATYNFPEADHKPKLSAQQQPITENDSYSGAPGESSPLLENDYVPLKPRCDVILVNAQAHAPEGRRVRSIEVLLELNEIQKSLRVVGQRYWERSTFGWYPSEPEPFTQMSITYEDAWGGSDEGEREGERETITDNPVGKGFYHRIEKERVTGQPLPNLEPPDRTLQHPSDRLPPLAFGPVARNWTPRRNHAGTYDQAWQENRRPLLPEDFDERFYQCAPEDQQTDHLLGGEEVILRNLTPEGETRFTLPEERLPMQVILRNGARHNLEPRIDTLLIDPQQRWFTLLWRARVGLRQSIHEINTLIVGRPTRGWEHAQMMDIPYWDLRRLNEIGRGLKQQQAHEKRLRTKYTAQATAREMPNE
jgi:hypothetical protein